MENRVDVILYSKLGNENNNAGHIKCSREPHLARGPHLARRPHGFPPLAYITSTSL